MGKWNTILDSWKEAFTNANDFWWNFIYRDNQKQIKFDDNKFWKWAISWKIKDINRQSEINKNLKTEVDKYQHINALVKRSVKNTKNHYNNLSVLNGTKPIKTYEAIVIPDFVTFTYTCVIYTYYMEQLNQIIEAILK